MNVFAGRQSGNCRPQCWRHSEGIHGTQERLVGSEHNHYSTGTRRRTFFIDGYCESRSNLLIGFTRGFTFVMSELHPLVTFPLYQTIIRHIMESAISIPCVRALTVS